MLNYQYLILSAQPSFTPCLMSPQPFHHSGSEVEPTLQFTRLGLVEHLSRPHSLCILYFTWTGFGFAQNASFRKSKLLALGRLSIVFVKLIKRAGSESY